MLTLSSLKLVSDFKIVINTTNLRTTDVIEELDQTKTSRQRVRTGAQRRPTIIVEEVRGTDGCVLGRLGDVEHTDNF